MAQSVVATADSTNGRVKLDVSGGVPGNALYLFRRDPSGVGVVRDTSGGDVVWPAASGVLWTNVVPNPDGTGGTAGTEATLGTASVGPALSGFAQSLRHTRSTASSAARFGIRCGTAMAASTTYTVLLALRASAALSAVAVNVRPDTSSSTGQVAVGGSLSLAAGVVQWVVATITTSATAPTANAGVAIVWSTGAVGTTLDVVAAIVAGTTTGLTGPFTGSYTPDPGLLPAWTGTPGASTSTLSGASVVTVYDHEARQGTATDYLLANGDGVVQATVRIDVPLWGTWLKSPGRPYLNTRCFFGSESPVQRKARRATVDIEGTAQPLVLSEARSTRGGTLTLAALTLAQATALDKLLDDGTTLMLDTNPAWGIPFRYLSVGDTTSSRGLSDGQLGLERAERVFTLSDVLHVDAPIGVTVVDPGRTYATLPTLYGNYAALAAINSSYDALALGTDD